MQMKGATVETHPQIVETKAPDRPAVVVECFVRHIEAGEIEPAIRLLSREIITRIGSRKLESILSTSSSEVWSAGGIESVDVQTLAFSRDHAEMQLTLWYGDHRIEREMIALVRESNQWRISFKEVNMIAAEQLH